MADKKISQLTTLVQADVAVTADFLPIVDTSATETKKATPQSVVLGALGATSANVGIGTASPAYRLDVSGAIRSSNAGNENIFLSDGSVHSSLQGGTGLLYFNVNSNSASHGQVIWRSSNAFTERMRLDASGNLGIGTASPAATLDVTGPSNALQARFGNQAGRGLEIKTFLAVGSNNAGVIYDAPVVGAGTHVFQTGSVERMRIDDDGNVSVGNGALATTATDGYLYVPTCAGTPTGTPTAKTGYAPIVVNTTNNKLYFYSGGAWRDAGP